MSVLSNENKSVVTHKLVVGCQENSDCVMQTYGENVHVLWGWGGACGGGQRE